jgi:L-fucose isomerase-like protein
MIIIDKDKTRYRSEDARPSHFQGVRDITLITLMVGKSLISRGMYPQGLYKSVIKPMVLNIMINVWTSFLFNFVLLFSIS